MLIRTNVWAFVFSRPAVRLVVAELAIVAKLIVSRRFGALIVSRVPNFSRTMSRQLCARFFSYPLNAWALSQMLYQPCDLRGVSQDVFIKHLLANG